MITLYGFKGRSRAERVLWALRELELPHEMIRLDFRKGESRTLEFLKLNPSGKVPVLLHGDRLLTESVAIIQYLDTIATQPKLIPQDSWEKYLYDNRISYGLTEVEPYLWIADQALFLDNLYSWPPETAKSALEIAKGNLEQIEEWLRETQYITGSLFSSADIIFYHLLTWARFFQINLSERTHEYLTNLEARSYFPKSMAVTESPVKIG